MTNYNDGNWHGWNGGECPVHPLSKVNVVLYQGKADVRNRAEQYGWYHNQYYPEANIVAFRVVKEHREPKEYTIDPRKNIIWYSSEDDLVHVKELEL